MVAFTQVAAGVEDAHRALVDRVEALVGRQHALTSEGRPEGAPASAAAGIPVCDGVTTLASIEREVVLATLDRCGGHRQRTADALGIGVRTLGMKLRAWKDAGIIAETR